MVGEKPCSEWVQDREETALGTESKIILNGFYFKKTLDNFEHGRYLGVKDYT